MGLPVWPATSSQRSGDGSRFEQWLSTLYQKKWVAYAQGPPSGIEGPDAVLKYLARYVTGVAISDKRLVSHGASRVVFRRKNYRSGGRQQTTSVAGAEFVRRWGLCPQTPGILEA